MLELLRDPVWQFIGAVLTLGALGLTAWIYFAQRTSKRVLVERIARVPLVTMGPEAIPGLTVSLNGIPVTQATVLVLLIENIGNAPILASDYESPITITFEDAAQVLDASLSSASPKSLPVKFDTSRNTLSVSPMLLNPGDTFSCRALVKDSTAQYVASARIAGVKNLESARPIPLAKSIATAACLLWILCAVVVSPSPMSIRVQDVRPEEVPYMIAINLGFLALLALAGSDLKGRLDRLKARARLWRGEA